jgi:hypothetical protein
MMCGTNDEAEKIIDALSTPNPYVLIKCEMADENRLLNCGW